MTRKGALHMQLDVDHLTFWNYRKNVESRIYFDNLEESERIQSVLKRNGWTTKNGVWHSPKEVAK